jgi:phosphate transport system permease protein
VLLNSFGTLLALVCVLLALIPLTAMVLWVLQKGASTLSLDFFTKNPPPQGEAGGGVFPDLVGTCILMAATSLIGIPIGLLSGVYLARSRTSRIASSARFMVDVIAGTPSILAGTVVAALFVFPSKNPAAIWGAVALALLMFPTVTRATEAALLAVPSELREAALGLGSPDWRLTMRVMLPTASAGIITAIVLGVARVAGETAPLILTVTGNNFVNTNPLHGQMGALPLVIWNDYSTGIPADLDKAFAAAFVLFALVVVLNLLARMLTYRLNKRTRL